MVLFIVSTSPAEMHRPSSSQTFYVLPDPPVQIPQRPCSSHSYPMSHNMPEQNNIFTQNMILSSPQQKQQQQPTFDQPTNQVQILSDEVIDATKLNPILREAFFRAVGDKLKYFITNFCVIKN